MSDVLDTWPALPVILMPSFDRPTTPDQRWDNTVAALESEHSGQPYL